MSKNHDKRTQIRLSPDNLRRLKFAKRASALNVSISELGNRGIELGFTALVDEVNRPSPKQ